jgi:hypothetical protein
VNETWRPVLGYEGLYEVSSFGRIRSSARQGTPGKTLIGVINRVGYVVVALWKENRQSTRTVHRLVLEAFAGPCPEGHECRHLDGSRTNNKLANLTWGTSRENSQDAYTHGTLARDGETGRFVRP